MRSKIFLKIVLPILFVFTNNYSQVPRFYLDTIDSIDKYMILSALDSCNIEGKCVAITECHHMLGGYRQAILVNSNVGSLIYRTRVKFDCEWDEKRLYMYQCIGEENDTALKTNELPELCTRITGKISLSDAMNIKKVIKDKGGIIDSTDYVDQIEKVDKNTFLARVRRTICYYSFDIFKIEKIKDKWSVKETHRIEVD
jgi:hypothetical protein